ncbi:guanylate kinase [Pelomicrobium methylotrophicum]|uniref:Guanylate kinase n=1 Tax=Pelomicrobium methylotrophicum TaxID=2602750 RepID=A0A5C7EQW3_9PROT|nr:guanylate kinase [Pelomicrobium methylotrophicum]TXF10596.1 guanylate kinase [Pelomicrobium methylotrophicum]
MTGILFIVAAPSGAGKTSLVAALLQRDPKLRLSVSYTTRPPREGEVDGRHYHFVDRATFQAMLERGEFLESAEVYGNCYGTSQRWVSEQLASGTDVLLEIDCQGAAQVRRLMPEAVGIFVLPPSLKVLRERLERRGTEQPEAIARRLAAAQGEMRRVSEFDYVIINDQFDEALEDLTSVVRAERLKVARQMERHGRLIESLTK